MSQYGGSTSYSSYTLANNVSSNTSISNKVSTLVEQQFPQHLREDSPNLTAFLKGYYEFLEQSNNALETSRNLLNYQDVDNTYDKYLEFIQREIMPSIPRDTLADKKHLAKHIKDLYRSKGSEQSYKLLFRLLYNEEIEFYYPGDDILRASDGRWEQDKVIRVATPRVGSSDDLVGEIVFGSESQAQARVSKFTTTLAAGIEVDQLYLVGIVGTFRDGELVTNLANTVNATIYGNIGPIQSVAIQENGALHQSGDRVSFTAASGTGANGTIVSTTGDSAVQYNIVFGGEGYNTNATVEVTGGSGQKANFRVASINNTEIINLCSTIIEPVENNTIDPTIQGGNTYASVTAITANTTAMGANLASANSGTSIINGTLFTNTTVGSIASLEILDYGFGYNVLPAVSVTQNNVVLAGLEATNQTYGTLKGANAKIDANNAPGAITEVTVDNIGDNYNRDNTVTINNLDRSGTFRAIGTPSVSGVIEFPGGYTDTKGFLSGSSKLQDNFYYQEFSYEIKSNQFVDKYREVVNKLIHPAGTKLFGRLDVFANLDASFISMRSDATNRIQIEQGITIDIPTVQSESEQSYILDEDAITIEPFIEGELNAVTPVPEVDLHMNLLKQGTGNIFISNKTLISDFSSTIISTYANVAVGLIGTTKLVVGNNTLFSVEVPTTNTGLLIIDSYTGVSANQLFFSNQTFSNTALSLKTHYGDTSNTVANGTFYYTANSDA